MFLSADAWKKALLADIHAICTNIFNLHLLPPSHWQLQVAGQPIPVTASTLGDVDVSTGGAFTWCQVTDPDSPSSGQTLLTHSEIAPSLNLRLSLDTMAALRPQTSPTSTNAITAAPPVRHRLLAKRTRDTAQHIEDADEDILPEGGARSARRTIPRLDSHTHPHLQVTQAGDPDSMHRHSRTPPRHPAKPSAAPATPSSMPASTPLRRARALPLSASATPSATPTKDANTHHTSHVFRTPDSTLRRDSTAAAACNAVSQKLCGSQLRGHTHSAPGAAGAEAWHARSAMTGKGPADEHEVSSCSEGEHDYMPTEGVMLCATCIYLMHTYVYGWRLADMR